MPSLPNIGKWNARKNYCEQHGLQTTLFCTSTDCDCVLCVDCVDGHVGHKIISLKAACEEKKQIIEARHSRMVDLTGELRKAQERGNHLRGRAETKHAEKTGSIDGGFKKGQHDLTQWREVECDKVNRPHLETTRILTDSIEQLRSALDGGEGLSTAFKTLLGAPPALFLRDFKQLVSKMDNQITSAKTSIEKQTAQFTRLESELERVVVYPRVLRVEEVVTDRSYESKKRQIDGQSENAPTKEITGTGEPTSPLTASASCETHTKKIALFCGTCDEALCLECFGEKHSDHTIKKLTQAFEEKKASLESGLKSWTPIKESLQGTRDKIYSLKEEVKSELGQRIDQINANYRSLQQELEKCRLEKIATVDSVRSKCAETIAGSAHSIDGILEEMNHLGSQYRGLLSRSEEWLVQESKKLAERIATQESSAEKIYEREEKEMTKIQDSLKNRSATSARQVKFTDVSKPDAVVICEEGLSAKDKPGDSANATCVRTHGLTSQLHYWEVEVSWKVSAPIEPGK